MLACCSFFNAAIFLLVDRDGMSRGALDNVFNGTAAGAAFLGAAGGVLVGRPFRLGAIGLAIALLFNFGAAIWISY